jgi:hypothetical protein
LGSPALEYSKVCTLCDFGHLIFFARTGHVLNKLTNLAGADVTTLGAKIFHSGQGQLPEVAVLNTRTDQGHWDVSLHPVDPRPWWDKCQDPGNKIDEDIWGI